MEDDSGSGVGPLSVEMQDVDCLSGIRAYNDGVHGAVIIDRAECYDFSPVVEAELEEIFHNIEQVFSVVNSPKKRHKWREKSDVQGLFCCSNGLESSGFDEDPSGECKETTTVLLFSDTRAANCGVSAAAKLQGMVDPCMIDVQASSGVNSSKKHLLWCEIFYEQNRGWFLLKNWICCRLCPDWYGIWLPQRIADLYWSFLMLKKKKLNNRIFGFAVAS